MKRIPFSQVLKTAAIDIRREYDRLYGMFCVQKFQDMVGAGSSLKDYCATYFVRLPFRGTCVSLDDFDDFYGYSFEKNPSTFDIEYLVSFCEYSYNLAIYNQNTIYGGGIVGIGDPMQFYVQQVTKVFSKMLFDYLRALSPRNSMPINLILEEAHRFVRSDMDYGVLGYNIFERIAKEGRKFGLLMGISSQRPSELSKTVVSQCNNFIIHKIQNPDDIQYISRMVPYMNQGMVDRITYLRRGYALVFGTAINLPTLTAFEKASPSPNSGNSNIVEKWYVD